MKPVGVVDHEATNCRAGMRSATAPRAEVLPNWWKPKPNENLVASRVPGTTVPTAVRNPSTDSLRKVLTDWDPAVTDGKILLNAGHSKSGNVVDSIHMQIEFSDDPGTIYEMNGGARTRFAEDDY